MTTGWNREPFPACRSPRILDIMLAAAVLSARCHAAEAGIQQSQRLLPGSRATQLRSAFTGFWLSLASLARPE
jgi:hypothetical protein